MAARGAPWKPKRHRPRGIYYRVEVYDEVSVCWVDAPGTFESIEKAAHFINTQLVEKQARIMKIDGAKRTVVI